jgi:hypothetical protein
MNADHVKEIYRGYEITAVEVKRGFKFVAREKKNMVVEHSSHPIRDSSLSAMIEAGKEWVDEKHPPTLGVQTNETVQTEDKFG